MLCWPQAVQPTPLAQGTPIVYTFNATYYHPSLAGGTLGCTGYGQYDPTDETTVAVGPGFYGVWPCGTQLEINGPAGSIQAVRKDSCPGCTTQLDLSKAGYDLVCGGFTS